MIPTRTNLDIQKEHEIFLVKRALEARFRVECEIEEPEDPDYVTKEIGMWFLDVYIWIDREHHDYEQCFVVYRAHEGWEVKLGSEPPPDAIRSSDEILHPDSWEGVVEAITNYLIGHPHVEERDAHQP